MPRNESLEFTLKDYFSEIKTQNFPLSHPSPPSETINWKFVHNETMQRNTKNRKQPKTKTKIKQWRQLTLTLSVLRGRGTEIAVRLTRRDWKWFQTNNKYLVFSANWYFQKEMLISHCQISSSSWYLKLTSSKGSSSSSRLPTFLVHPKISNLRHPDDPEKWLYHAQHIQIKLVGIYQGLS